MKLRFAVVVCFLLASVALISTSLLAQTFRGTILGTVSDPQGAVRFGREGHGAQREYGAGSQHDYQFGWQLFGSRVADRHLR